MSDTYFLIIGILLFIIGACFLILQIRRRLSCSGQVLAVIVEVQRKKISTWKGKAFFQYFSTFSYQAEGKNYLIKHPVKNDKTYQKGNNVLIYYNPKAPENIYTGGSLFLCISSILLLLFGLILIICFFL